MLKMTKLFQNAVLQSQNSISAPLGEFSKQNGEKNLLIECLDYLYENKTNDDHVEFLFIQIGDVTPRDSLYMAISLVKYLSYFVHF
jgi:hypothetical protein